MFKFELGQQVTIKASGEKGTVEACAKYISSGNSYYIHYRAADGRAVTQWFEERHIEDGTARKVCDCPLCDLRRQLPQLINFTFDVAKQNQQHRETGAYPGLHFRVARLISGSDEGIGL